MYVMYGTYESGTCENQRMGTDHLDLDIRMVTRHQLVMGSELGSSARTVTALSRERSHLSR